MRTRVNLIPNLDLETKNTRIKTQHMWDKNPTRFYCNNKTRIEQNCDKKTYPK